MINEAGEIEAANTVPKLVKALEQSQCEHPIYEDGSEEPDCHRCNDLITASVMLQLFDKLVMLYHQAHRCLDVNHCKVCLMVEAYGLDIQLPEESTIVLPN